MLTATAKNKILSIISVFETSKPIPDYDVLVVLNDGPNRSPQITYGKHQTTEHSNLKAMLQMYCDNKGRYGKELQAWLHQIGKIPLCYNNDFKYLLKMAGTDIIMHQTQDFFFDKYYWNPAYKFFDMNRFMLPLSMAVIYDSYIHSGSVLSFLRDRFAEVPPVRGGTEKSWIKAYVTVRDQWLENHSSELLRNTDYRTDCWLEQIENNNWELMKPVVCKFNQKDKAKWITIP